MGDWISVENRLPDDYGVFLFVQNSGHVGMCRFDCWNDTGVKSGQFVYMDNGKGLPRVTHWQPLPLPPK